MFSEQDQKSTNSNNYTNITKTQTNAVKINPVFHFLELLISRKDPNIAAYKLDDPKNKIVRADREAYLLNFTTAPNRNLFASIGFTVQERHLSIDKWYSLPTSEKGNCGYAAAHYTENYVHANGARKTVHVYLTKAGTYIQVKSAPNQTDTMTFEANPQTSYLQNLASINAQEAFYLYDCIDSMRAMEWRTIAVEVEHLEESLSALSTQLSSKAKQLEYIKQARKCIGLINKKNALDEFDIDYRGERLNELVAKINTLTNPEPARLAESEPSSEPQSSSSRPAPVLVASDTDKKPVQDYQTSWYEELKKLDEKLQLAKNGNKIADIYLIARRIKVLAVEFYFFKNVTAEQKNLVDTLYSNTKDIEKPFEFALTQFKQGNTEGFKSMFPFLSENDQFLLSDKIIYELKAQDSDTGPVAESQREMCWFLYEQSSSYKFRLKMENVAYHAATEVKNSCSLLFYLFMKRSIHSFSMLLDQGLNPNRTGFIHDNLSFSLFRLLVAFDTTQTFGKILLAHGALVDDTQSNMSARELVTYNKKITQYSKPSEEALSYQTKLKAALKENLFEYASDLISVCVNGHYDLIPLILDQSSLASTVVALSILAIVPTISQRQVLNLTVKNCILENKEQADSESQHLMRKENQMTIMFYGNGAAKERIQAIKLLWAAIDTKMPKTDSELDQVLSELEAMQKKYEGSCKDKIYMACKILVCKRGELNQDWALKLMRYYCYIGRCYNLVGAPDLAHAQYNLACEIGRHFKLQDSPMFAHAAKYFNSTANNRNSFHGKHTREVTLEVQIEPGSRSSASSYKN